jgi:hypothetical protein
MARTHYRNGDEISLSGGCDGCQPANINGVFCHETGCPDAWRDHESECDECGMDFYPKSRGERVCQDCMLGVEVDGDFDLMPIDEVDGDYLD